MSVLLEKNSLVHITCEAITVVLILVYVTVKHNKLAAQITEMSNKINEQQEIINRHELILERILSTNCAPGLGNDFALHTIHSVPSIMKVQDNVALFTTPSLNVRQASQGLSPIESVIESDISEIDEIDSELANEILELDADVQTES